MIDTNEFFSPTYHTVIRLYLYGDKLDPDFISELLQENPDRSHMKGHVGISRTSGKLYTPKLTGFWSKKISTTAESFEVSVAEALTVIEKGEVDLLTLPGVTSGVFDIYIDGGKQYRDGVQIFSKISAEQLSKIAALKLSLQITCYGDSIDSARRPLEQREIDMVSVLLTSEPKLRANFLANLDRYQCRVYDKWGSLALYSSIENPADATVDGAVAIGKYHFATKSGFTIHLGYNQGVVHELEFVPFGRMSDRTAVNIDVSKIEIQ